MRTARVLGVKLTDEIIWALRQAVRRAYLDGEDDGPRSYAATAWAVKGECLDSQSIDKRHQFANELGGVCGRSLYRFHAQIRESLPNTV